MGHSTRSPVLSIALHVRFRTPDNYAMQSRCLGGGVRSGVVEMYQRYRAKFPRCPQGLHVSRPSNNNPTAQRIVAPLDPTWIDVSLLGYEAERPNLTR
jgi:hypothetical protein